MLSKETSGAPVCPVSTPLEDALDGASAAGACGWIELGVFAGQLPAAELRRIAGVVQDLGDGFLAISRDQNVLVSLGVGINSEPLKEALRVAGLLKQEETLQCRVCPGSHLCTKGLVPTRDVARQLDAILGDSSRALSWAISGCPNSCSQPQLADFGIIGVRKGSDKKEALYDLYKRSGKGFGKPLREKLNLDELLKTVAEFG